ncbi:MAG: hypothetical protein DDT32_02037 [Syntrophomonadaceae bacterium]|nr:hypothetical protein [Bacillota bacterium]
MTRKVMLLVAVVVFFPWLSFAHHAMEYIELEGYTMTGEGEKVFYVMYDYTVPDKDVSGKNHWEITPGMSYGITERLMFDIHTHFAKFGAEHVVEEERGRYPEGPSPFIEAFAGSLQYQLTRKNQFPIDIALAAKYEYPLSRSRKILGGERVIKGTLILSKDLTGHRNTCLNLSYGKDGDEKVREWGVGVRTPLTVDPHGVALSLELLGDFKGAAFLLTGIFLPVMENTIFRVGLGLGNKKADDLRFHTGLMHRF